MPSSCAFDRSAGAVRFICFETSAMGVRAFECALRAFTSSLVYSLRAAFLTLITFIISCGYGPRALCADLSK